MAKDGGSSGYPGQGGWSTVDGGGGWFHIPAPAAGIDPADSEANAPG